MNISFGMIFKELYSQKRRIILTILAIAWGTASIAGMLAVGEGLRQTFGRGIGSGGKPLITVYPAYTSLDSNGKGKGIKVLLNQQDVDNLALSLKKYGKKMDLVGGVFEFAAVLSYKRQITQASAQAVLPSYFAAKGIKVAPGGRVISDIDEAKQKKVVVLGYKIAEGLFDKGVNPIHKDIMLGGRVFNVIGVTQSKFQFGGPRGQSDANIIWIPQSTYKGLTNSLNYSALFLFPNNPDESDETDKIIRRVIALKGGYNPEDPEFVMITDSAKTQKTMQQIFLGMQIFLGIIGGVTLLVAGVGISNVMLISVKQNIRDIGIQMAIGAKSINILMHYVLEGLITTFIGGFMGLLLVKLIVYLIGLIPVKGSFFAQIGSPKPIMSGGIIVAVIIVLGVIGFVSALFPAFKASRIDPAVALRES